MSDDEFRALVEAGPCVVMVAKSDMLRLLDERQAMREALAPFASIWGINKCLSPEPSAPIARFVAWSWPRMEDAKIAHDLLHPKQKDASDDR
jgi:hypothetical protein